MTTPTTPATSASTPTPTQTWDDNQSAAIQAVKDYYAAKGKLMRDPTAFNYAEAKKLLAKVTGGDMTSGNLKLWNDLGAAGKRWEGEGTMLWTTAAAAVVDDRGDQVSVTECSDYTAVFLVDKKGKKTPLEDQPSARLFSVRKVTGDDRWRVYGEQEGEGACP